MSLQILNAARIWLCAADGPRLSSGRDATDIIGDAYGAEVAVVALPASRLTDEFFDLSTRLAGEFVQKFVNYGAALAIVGDISAHIAASSALRDFVYESNRGRHLWFVDSLDDLAARL
ncbi:DUF4180 domain-containing protein [Phenylobacterium sp. 20VBR1]|uniref:DUF4180 domain-containing protein n=1 Tax=Phenylobacterium glaciei TaxID=2803784 RepID=A0A941HWV3_9CAUL|nr:DUF4180 domain-containing protein [Phenylobacterium glaciei]MBR7620446.1 DUF4180 domain-containing protein [Phenylobacterium glaciei]